MISKPGGVLERPGHTEAAVDLAKLAGSKGLSGCICEIMNKDGTMAKVPELMSFSVKYNIKVITIAALIEFKMKI